MQTHLVLLYLHRCDGVQAHLQWSVLKQQVYELGLDMKCFTELKADWEELCQEITQTFECDE